MPGQKWIKGAYRSVKDEFRSFKEMKIPDGHYSIWVIRSIGVLVVRRNHQLGKLGSVSLSSLLTRTQDVPSETNLNP